MKKQELQLHQVLGIIAILAVISLSIYIALQRTQFLSEAGVTEDPKFINVVNENADGFTVAWITTKSTQGAVILPDENLTFVEKEENSKTHIIEITGLQAGKRYAFRVLSGTTIDDNLGVNYEAFTTKYQFPVDNKLLFGRIFGKDSITPLKDGYVTIHAEIDGLSTNKIYSRLNDQGGWQIDYSRLLSKTLTQKYDVTQKALVTLSIYSPEIIDPVTRSYDIKLIETLQITDIFLGEDVPWELPAIQDESIQVQP